jgi:hypothetical protein
MDLQKGVRWALHWQGGVLHAATNWVKQCDASTMCRPLESTAGVRLAMSRQGASLGNATAGDPLMHRATALALAPGYRSSRCCCCL